MARRLAPWAAALCFVLTALAPAAAQNVVPGNPPPAAAPPAPPAPPPDDENFFDKLGHWFGRRADDLNATLQGAGSTVKNIGAGAGAAARSTVDTARDAAGAVVKIPGARVVRGHAKCVVAPNGAPDCVAAANEVCKSKGYASGSSVDMTTAENCPPRVWMSGRLSGPECTTETFVSKAVCQ